MSEKIYRCLLRLYPAHFREAYHEEALQLFRDRSRDERGSLPVLRLWLDLVIDTAVSAPSQYRRPRAAAMNASGQVCGAPSFCVLEYHPPRLGALLFGGILSLSVAMASIPIGQLPNQPAIGGSRSLANTRWQGAGLPAKLSQLTSAPSQGSMQPQYPRQGAPGVKFEVASIKPTLPGDRRRPAMEFLAGGRFRAINTPLFQVLATAYNVPWQSIEVLQLRVKGIPEWMFNETYDIEAKAESPSSISGSSVKARNERIRLMLQSLLADRLKLKLRREITNVQGYALVVAKAGPKLQKAKTPEAACVESAPFAPLTPTGPGCHQIQGGTGRGIHATAIDMSDLALFVSNWSERPIIDATGLPGLYSVETEGWSPAGDNPSRPSLDEILDRLGLRLDNRKLPMETLVLEHIEKPSSN
jgi:uncharacterized protein (TIGR03435 family)